MKHILKLLALTFVTLLVIGFSLADNSSADGNLEEKKDIHYKMLNTVDYFESVKGNFDYKNSILDVDVNIDYKVKTGNSNSKPSSKVVIQNKEISTEHIYDGEDIIEKNLKKETYKKADMAKRKVKIKDKNKVIEARYQRKDNGEKVYIYRPDTIMAGMASMSIFPQEIALGFLEDYDNWSIASETQMNGHNAVVIEGSFNDYYQQKHRAITFELFVDKDTGVILQLNEYDKQGKVVTSLETKSIKFNTEIKGSNFSTKVPKGFEKVKSK
ncbi:LolA family protein [Halobacillus hunanensis]|uniref:LolA family protein n=1 Tax=Halobacillus hunanensis TaxID=578214 RepID=UPI0009A70B1F|nr:hypothetical protein [Halobacillus hunanensis]